MSARGGLPPFQAVIDEHGPAVWRYLVATAGAVDAADCYQETFLSALRAYPALRPASSVRAWLITIAHRKAIDSWRAAGRRAIPVAEVPEAVAGEQEEPDDALWEAVRGLPDKQRTAVVMRFVADLPYDDIAAALDCSPDAARQSVHAGVARLRALDVAGTSARGSVRS